MRVNKVFKILFANEYGIIIVGLKEFFLSDNVKSLSKILLD